MSDDNRVIDSQYSASGNVSDGDKVDKKPSRHGIANLRPQNTRTKEEQRQIAIAGGKASGEARRKKRELRERCKLLLELMPNADLVHASLDGAVDLPEGSDMYDLMIAKMMQVAVLEGNVKAFVAVRDSAGDKPVDETNINAAVMTDKDLELMRIIEQRMSTKDGQKD